MGDKKGGRRKKPSKKTLKKRRQRCKNREIEENLTTQFKQGRLFACISSRPGQSGRSDGYIIEDFGSKMHQMVQIADISLQMPQKREHGSDGIFGEIDRDRARVLFGEIDRDMAFVFNLSSKRLEVVLHLFTSVSNRAFSDKGKCEGNWLNLSSK